MGNYDVCVKNMETYTICEAESEEDAIMQAIDCFKDDDMHHGADYTESVTEEDCEIMWSEEY